MGKVFAALRPRLAVGYHVYNDRETLRGYLAAVRGHYDGPLECARDLMVFNVTPEQVRAHGGGERRDLAEQGIP